MIRGPNDGSHPAGNRLSRATHGHRPVITLDRHADALGMRRVQSRIGKGAGDVPATEAPLQYACLNTRASPAQLGPPLTLLTGLRLRVCRSSTSTTLPLPPPPCSRAGTERSGWTVSPAQVAEPGKPEPSQSPTGKATWSTWPLSTPLALQLTAVPPGTAVYASSQSSLVALQEIRAPVLARLAQNCTRGAVRRAATGVNPLEPWRPHHVRPVALSSLLRPLDHGRRVPRAFGSQPVGD